MSEKLTAKLEKEREALGKRIASLDAFIDSNQDRASSAVNDRQYRLLRAQYFAMCLYDEVLYQRIADLNRSLDDGEEIARLKMENTKLKRAIEMVLEETGQTNVFDFCDEMEV